MLLFCCQQATFVACFFYAKNIMSETPNVYALPGMRGAKTQATVEGLCTIVQQLTGIETAAITGRSRQKNVVFARQLVMWGARRFSKLPLSQIAYPLGNRDHSTVVHSAKRIEALRFSKDKEFYKAIKAFDDTCRGLFAKIK